MKCMSCQSDINPKWKFAIENNSCPCCGDKIMEEELKNLLSTLSSTINSLTENYSEQLNDWLLSNFNYIKTNSPNLKNYLPKELFVTQSRQSNSSFEDNELQDEDDELVKKVSDEQAARFFKNSGADKVVKRTQELKELVQKIKSENPSMKTITSADVSEMEENYDQEEDRGAYDEDIPPAVLAFANQSNKKDPSYNQKDMLRLQQLQQRTLESRRNMVNGTGGKGSFSRSS